MVAQQFSTPADPLSTDPFGDLEAPPEGLLHDTLDRTPTLATPRVNVTVAAIRRALAASLR